MANTPEVCCSSTASNECLKNHLSAFEFFRDAIDRGRPSNTAPWKFCPWCGKPLPANPKNN